MGGRKEREMEEVGGVDGEGDGRGSRGRMLRKQGERIKIIYYMANSFISTLIRLRRGGGAGGIGLGLFKFFTFLTNTCPHFRLKAGILYLLPESSGILPKCLILPD